MAKRQRITDEEMDRLEQELRDYLRTPRDSWKREPKMRLLLERNKQFKEELKRKAPTEPPQTNPE
jgi:hypothetical protein